MNVRRTIQTMIALFVAIVVFGQGCSHLVKSDPASAPSALNSLLSASGEMSGKLSVGVFESLGAREFPVEETEALVVGQSYRITVLENGIDFANLRWFVKSDPAQACTVKALSDPTQIITCHGPASVEVKVYIGTGENAKITSIKKLARTTAATRVLGRNIYEQKCGGCHGGPEQSNISGHSPHSIAAAITKKLDGAMSTMNLAPLEMHALSAALSK